MWPDRLSEHCFGLADRDSDKASCLPMLTARTGIIRPLAWWNGPQIICAGHLEQHPNRLALALSASTLGASRTEQLS